MNEFQMIEATVHIIALGVASFSAYMALRTLKANHDWNRRSYTANMIADWNTKTGEHRRVIEKLKPGLFNIDRGDFKAIILDESQAIIKASTPKNAELNYHLVELLNYLEFIASTHQNCVADPEMIEDSFKAVMLRWHQVLVNYINVYAKKKGEENPWRPYEALIEKWNRLPFDSNRLETDDLSIRAKPKTTTEPAGIA